MLTAPRLPQLSGTDPRLISEIFRNSDRIFSDVGIRINKTSHRGRVLSCHDDKLNLEFDGPEPLVPTGSPCVIEFNLFEVHLLLEAVLLQSPYCWQLAPPFHVSMADQRQTARIPLSTGVAVFRLQTSVEGDSSFYTADVQDFTPDGARVVVWNQHLPPLAGNFSATLEVDGESISCVVTLCYCRLLDDGVEYGVKFIEGHKHKLMNAYMRHRFPSLRPRQFSDQLSVSNLIANSGYLDLCENRFIPQSWLDSANIPNVSHDLIYQSCEGSPIGHISITRAYSRTWLCHQLATLKHTPEHVNCILSLYSYPLYNAFIEGPESKILLYYDRSETLHRTLFESFARWVTQEVFVVLAFDRFELDVNMAEMIEEPSSPCVEIREANQSDLIEATALIQSQLPPLAVDAFDINPDQLQATCLHPAYEGGRYARRRKVYVLYTNALLSGVALCETGSASLSLFNVFNMSQMFFSTGSSAPSPQAQLQLVHRICAFYLEVGVANPIVITPPGSFISSREPGIRLVETMGCIVLSGKAIRSYENFINLRTGKYLQLAERKRRKEVEKSVADTADSTNEADAISEKENFASYNSCVRRRPHKTLETGNRRRIVA